ncbi:MAG: hypothetical protein NT106_13825 [Candidatus Sumerlaeota bacterium]|nr:hypothetical protein [Candidatus Sumerlaeota bacterium]
MAYTFKCRECSSNTWTANIVELFENYTNASGRFVCPNCKSTDTYIYKKSKLQEPGDFWERWIKGVIRIKTEYETYSPYIFLTAGSEDGDISDLHFNYYKDLRPQGGLLKPGAGPGGGPVLGVNDLFYVLRHLVKLGVLTKDYIVRRISKF